jgi:hypothetical protein
MFAVYAEKADHENPLSGLKWAMFRKSNLKSGQTMLVQGASGGMSAASALSPCNITRNPDSKRRALFLAVIIGEQGKPGKSPA